MRLKILTQPLGTVDGVSLDHFRVGRTYEISPLLACVFLTEGWAELVSEGTAAVPERAPPVSAIPSREPLVLVVDDDAAARDFAVTLLCAHGYHVMVAAHGHEAMLRLIERCPDLIVLDLNMPVMDGWEFRGEQCAFPDQRRASVPVLLMTGEDDAAAHALALRAVGAVQKPFETDALLAAVSAAIGGSDSGSGRRTPGAAGS